jgi:tRNA modification GTPase
MSNNDTICALATAPGGALGIIRISGPLSFSVVSAICSVSFDPVEANTVHFTRLTDGTDVIDEAMVSVFKAPHSYTGEDSVEISCHGSRYILNKVLELLVQNGCRMAGPGEYTQRAYLNGKMDLSQAEAVADLIASTNKATHQLAINQLRGGFSSELATLRDQLLHLTSLLELELDFSDHEDLEFADRTELLTLAQHIDQRITTLAHSFETGQALKQGIPVAIVGKTNVGKSTLLNALLNDNRAIVSDVHGTTRDTIEETLDINGVTFRFIDTAGLRETTDTVEKIGIDRTHQKISEARIIIWLLDEMPTQAELSEMNLLSEGKSTIYVHNKSDLFERQTFTPYISPLLLISAKKRQNIDTLKNKIYEAAHLQALADNDIIITSARHYEALIHAHTNLQQVINGIQTNLSGDLIAEDLRLVLSDLADITGSSITPTETLHNIFKHFCIGK